MDQTNKQKFESNERNNAKKRQQSQPANKESRVILVHQVFLAPFNGNLRKFALFPFFSLFVFFGWPVMAFLDKPWAYRPP